MSITLVEILEAKSFLWVNFIYWWGPLNSSTSVRYKNNLELSDDCESLLFLASRNQLLLEKIIPDLDNGLFVLFDRRVNPMNGLKQK